MVHRPGVGRGDTGAGLSGVRDGVGPDSARAPRVSVNRLCGCIVSPRSGSLVGVPAGYALSFGRKSHATGSARPTDPSTAGITDPSGAGYPPLLSGLRAPTTTLAAPSTVMPE